MPLVCLATLRAPATANSKSSRIYEQKELVGALPLHLQLPLLAALLREEKGKEESVRPGYGCLDVRLDTSLGTGLDLEGRCSVTLRAHRHRQVYPTLDPRPWTIVSGTREREGARVYPHFPSLTEVPLLDYPLAFPSLALFPPSSVIVPIYRTDPHVSHDPHQPH
jgi:hypothetical protein